MQFIILSSSIYQTLTWGGFKAEGAEGSTPRGRQQKQMKCSLIAKGPNIMPLNTNHSSLPHCGLWIQDISPMPKLLSQLQTRTECNSVQKIKKWRRDEKKKRKEKNECNEFKPFKLLVDILLSSALRCTYKVNCAVNSMVWRRIWSLHTTYKTQEDVEMSALWWIEQKLLLL